MNENLKEDDLSPLEFEDFIINLLFVNSDAKDKLVPFLTPDVFDDFANKELVKNILLFNETHSKFPNVKEMKIFLDNEMVYKKLIGIMNLDLSAYGENFILGELEEFFRKKLVIDVITNTRKGLDERTNTLNDLPDKFREALSFSFDTRVGLSFLDDAERMYNALHNKDKVITTGVAALDKLIEGGWHEKSLTLYMAACVTKDTPVKIRFNRNESQIEYRTVSIGEIESLLSGYEVEVLSPDGYVPVKEYVSKGKKKIYNVVCGDYVLKASGKHLLETIKGWMFVESIKDELVLTKDGFFSCVVTPLDQEEEVVDIVVDHENHRYYTNGISSHNTNMGKTLIKCSHAADALKKNKNVLYITLEMSEDKISERIAANLLQTPINDLKVIDKTKFMKRIDSIRKVIGSNLIIKEYPPKSLSSNRIRNLLKELKVRKNFVPDIIFVDYMGLMVPNTSKKSSNSYEELKIVSEELRGVAVEQGCPIVSAAQLNRGGFGSAEIDLTDIADSIGVTATADIIIGITQTEEMRDAGQYVFLLLKNRYGINKKKCYVGVDYPKMTIYNVENEDDAPKSMSIVDDAAVQVLKTLNTNKKDKRDKMISFE